MSDRKTTYGVLLHVLPRDDVKIDGPSPYFALPLHSYAPEQSEMIAACIIGLFSPREEAVPRAYTVSVRPGVYRLRVEGAQYALRSFDTIEEAVGFCEEVLEVVRVNRRGLEALDCDAVLPQEPDQPRLEAPRTLEDDLRCKYCIRGEASGHWWTYRHAYPSNYSRIAAVAQLAQDFPRLRREAEKGDLSRLASAVAGRPVVGIEAEGVFREAFTYREGLKGIEVPGCAAVGFVLGVAKRNVERLSCSTSTLVVTN